MIEEQPSLKADFLATDQQKTSRRHTLILAAVFTVVVVVIAAAGANASYRAASKGTTVLTEVGNLPIISDIRGVFGSRNETTPNDKAPSDQLRILILGVGGDGHDGSQLTDSILLSTIDTKEKKVGLLSIPRDLAYPLGSGSFEKINSINAYAEQNNPGHGGQDAADAIGKLLDVPIDHYVKIDFRGFSALIDALGGIDVNVEHAFTDTQYPTADDKWMTVSFKKGQQHMSGERALMYVRSRHGSNFEGSDFARSRRQQLVIMAVREKLLSLGTLADPRKLASVYQSVSRNIQTDLSVWDLMKLAPLGQDFSPDKIVSRVLTDAPDGMLVAANVNGAYMLFPRKQDWSEVRDAAQNPFTTAEEEQKQLIAVEAIKIEIKNGTTRTGFASQISAQLEKNGFEINAFGNALRRGYERSVIYDLTNGKKNTELLKLKRLLNADISLSTSVTTTADNDQTVRVIYADGLLQERVLVSTTDFLIILGEASYPLLAK